MPPATLCYDAAEVPALEPLPTPHIVASALLLSSVLALWSRFDVWLVLTLAVVVAGYTVGIMHGPAVLWLAALACSAWLAGQREGTSRAGWLLAVAGLGVGLGVHALPGFSNPLVVRGAQLAADAIPYSQYANFDKTLGGTLLLGCGRWMAMRRAADWKRTFVGAWPVALATTVAVMTVSVAFAFVRTEPRWTPLFWTWAALNLLTTCVSEEAFFRGLVQTELRRIVSGRHAGAASVVIAALLFGVAHAAGGWRYVVLASLAGVGYGVAYERTGRLEAAILTHFALNSTHFLLFTYPALR